MNNRVILSIVLIGVGFIGGITASQHLAPALAVEAAPVVEGARPATIDAMQGIDLDEYVPFAVAMTQTAEERGDALREVRELAEAEGICVILSIIDTVLP